MIRETNLQNIPRDPLIKNMFVPREGRVFVEADLSQAESRIVAWQAEEKRLIEAYERGEDIHSLVGSMIFGKVVKKGMMERQAAKPISHGSNYGMGPRKLAEVVLKEIGVEMPESETRIRQARYYQAFSGIKDVFQRGIRYELKLNNRVLTNPFGRRRKFHQPWGDELFRQAYSHFAQSTVADVINNALINCSHSKYGIVVAQVHDSLLFEVDRGMWEDHAAEIVELIRVDMRVPFTMKGVVRVIPVEVKWGYTWGSLVEFTSEKPVRVQTAR